MAARVPALVEKELLVWARKSASMSVDAAAKAAKIPADKIEAWEAGDGGPSIPELKKLAAAYKRPLSVFFLPRPPTDFMPLRDFRRLAEVGEQEYSRALAYEVRAAQERRQVAIDLNEDLGGDLPAWTLSAKTSENPEQVAKRVREHLAITMAQQSRWGDATKAFKAWRDSLEERGVLVSVLGGAHHRVGLGEVRGFAIADRPLPMIVVNGKDRTNGRIFTLMHELAHVLLGVSAIENEVEPGAHMPAPDRAIETFCNRVAAAILMPEGSLRAENLAVGKNTKSEWLDAEIGALAQRYAVSREAMLIRLGDLGLASADFVRARRAAFAKEYAKLEAAALEDEEEDAGFPPPTMQLVYFLGGAFARLVLRAYYGQMVTLSTASGYLGTQAKHVGKIERYAFGAAGAP